MWEMSFFGLKLGLDLEMRAAHPRDVASIQQCFVFNASLKITVNSKLTEKNLGTGPDNRKARPHLPFFEEKSWQTSRKEILHLEALIQVILTIFFS